MVTSPKVLVIDDSATSSLFITQALRKAGYHVITAVNGNEGIGGCGRLREDDPRGAGLQKAGD